MPKLTLVSGSNETEGSPQNTSERLINCFAEPSPQGAVSAFRIRPVLGNIAAIPSTVSDGTASSVKDVIARPGDYFGKTNTVVFALQNGKLRRFQVESATVTDLGTLVDSQESTMALAGDDVAISTGVGAYYLWDESATALILPSGGRLTAVGSVAYLNGYTILTQSSGQEFEWTALGDPTTRNALYFATADARPDNIIRAMTAEGQLWLFGETSIEVWYITGQSGANAFARIPGAVLYTGLANIRSVVDVNNQLFFVGNDNRVYLTSGTNISAVSNPAVEASIAETQANFCFKYEHDGALFAAVQTDGSTWIFDFRTGLWHERTSLSGGDWDVNFTFKADDDWFGVHKPTGALRRFADEGRDYNGTTNVALPRTIVSRPFYNDGNQFSVSELEFLCEAGSTSEEDPEISLEISRDGGRTFGGAMTRSIGQSGDFEHRAVFRALGTYRNFTARLTMSVADNVVMYSDANMRLS